MADITADNVLFNFSLNADRKVALVIQQIVAGMRGPILQAKVLEPNDAFKLHDSLMRVKLPVHVTPEFASRYEAGKKELRKGC